VASEVDRNPVEGALGEGACGGLDLEGGADLERPQRGTKARGDMYRRETVNLS
jgi:hypothetical protein